MVIAFIVDVVLEIEEEGRIDYCWGERSARELGTGGTPEVEVIEMDWKEIRLDCWFEFESWKGLTSRGCWET